MKRALSPGAQAGGDSPNVTRRYLTERIVNPSPWTDPRSYAPDPYDLINHDEPSKSEWRYLLIGALIALAWLAVFLIARAA